MGSQAFVRKKFLLCGKRQNIVCTNADAFNKSAGNQDLSSQKL
jgi:hypothetical protein